MIYKQQPNVAPNSSLKESSAFHKLNQKMKQKRNNAVTGAGAAMHLGSMVGNNQ
jgi:hypothetical protein